MNIDSINVLIKSITMSFSLVYMFLKILNYKTITSKKKIVIILVSFILIGFDFFL